MIFPDIGARFPVVELEMKYVRLRAGSYENAVRRLLHGLRDSPASRLLRTS